MPKINNYRRITTGEYSAENTQLITNLANTLNPFMREVTDVLNGGLDFENVSFKLLNVELAVNEDGIPNTNKINTGKDRVNGFIVISARNLTNVNIPATSQPFITFTPIGNGLVNINKITGLPSANRFQLTLVVF